MSHSSNNDEIRKLIPDFDEDELAIEAESGRDELPAEFFDEMATAEAALLNDSPVPKYRPKSLGKAAPEVSLGQKMRDAVLLELRHLLCSSDKKYDDVREHGTVLASAATAAVSASLVSWIPGLNAAAAAAAVAFGILLVGKVGIGVFCRLVPSE